MADKIRDIRERRLRRAESGFGASVTRGDGDMVAARLRGAQNDLRTLQWAHDQAEQRYEAAKAEFLRTGDALDEGRVRLEVLQGLGGAVTGA